MQKNFANILKDCTCLRIYAPFPSHDSFPVTMFPSHDIGTQWGVLKKPAGTGKHPTIIFFHGVGEAGSGSSDAALGKLSTWGIFKDTWIEKFDVCYDISPNGATYNADIIKLEDIRVGNCRVGSSLTNKPYLDYKNGFNK